MCSAQLLNRCLFWLYKEESVSHSILCDSSRPHGLYSLPSSSVHGLLQAKILECVASPVSRESSRFRDWTLVSCIAGRFFTVWATREVLFSIWVLDVLQFYFVVPFRVEKTVFVYLLLVVAVQSVSRIWPNELQHIRLPCPSVSLRVRSNSCPLSWWCHPAVSLCVALFSSCPQSILASGFFPMSWLFASGGQNIGASASVLPIKYSRLISSRIDWFDISTFLFLGCLFPVLDSSTQPGGWNCRASQKQLDSPFLGFYNPCKQEAITELLLLVSSTQENKKTISGLLLV